MSEQQADLCLIAAKRASAAVWRKMAASRTGKERSNFISAAEQFEREASELEVSMVLS